MVQVVAPRIFNERFAEHGHDAVLVAFDLDAGAVGAFFDAMRRTANFRGSFVTVPHKQEATRHMDELTPRASILGVVNVVKRVDGRLIGDMTDGLAFLDAARSHGLDPAGARVAMIGGGGTATAIAHACAEQGVAELVLSVRNRDRHEELRRVVESVPNPPRLSFDLDSLDGFDLVINATTVGMDGDANVPHPVETLDPTSLVGEVVTLPRVTPWLLGRSRSRLPHPVRRRDGSGAAPTRRPMVGTRRHLRRLTRTTARSGQSGCTLRRTLSSADAGTSSAMKGSPTSCNNTNRSLPPCRFLSRRIASISSSTGIAVGSWVARPTRGHQCLDAVGESRSCGSPLLGEPRRGDESEADGLAMGQCIATDLFERVGERVPQVEDGPTCLLERIVLDDRDLDLDRLGDQRLEPAERVTFLVTRRVPFAPLELGQQVRSRDQCSA